MSPKPLLQPGLDRLLLRAVRRLAMAPRTLALVLTGSALAHSRDPVKPMRHRLRGQGLSRALNDCCTGDSSLSDLRQPPCLLLALPALVLPELRVAATRTCASALRRRAIVIWPIPLGVGACLSHASPARPSPEPKAP